MRYGERLAEIGTVPSIGSLGDSYDNALAETVNGYYKAALIRGPARTGPWKTIEEVELATLGWVHWHNTQRLHGYLGDLPPVEFEALPPPGKPSIRGCYRSPSPLAGLQNASHSLALSFARSRSPMIRCLRPLRPTPPLWLPAAPRFSTPPGSEQWLTEPRAVFGVGPCGFNLGRELLASLDAFGWVLSVSIVVYAWLLMRARSSSSTTRGPGHVEV